MPFQIDPFYPVLPSAQAIAQLVPAGVRMVQLRVKDLLGDALRKEIYDAQAVCTAHDCLLVVNDYWREAIECGCYAVHLGQEDLQDADLQSIRSAGLSLGVSTHDESELATAMEADPDYIAIGPIFPTSSKSLAWSSQGVERVSQWRSRVTDRPLVAIGGITLELAPQVLHAGADSVAVIADVTAAADPLARVRQWLEQTSAHRV